MKPDALILVVSATSAEVGPLQQEIERTWLPREGLFGRFFEKNNRACQFLVTGVGAPETLLSLGDLPKDLRPKLVLHLGIAGSFDRNLSLGQVVEVVSETYADLGAEDAEGRFHDLYALGLDDPDRFPYQKGLLHNPLPLALPNIPLVSGLTANTVSGHAGRIAARAAQFPATVESMEGAAVFDFCLRRGWPFAQLRGLSNYVEPRNRAAWQIERAVAHLNDVGKAILD